jgi:hypothetical protein
VSEKQIAAWAAQLDTSQKIVPFGKYRGQPVEVLRQDTSYLDWLAGQEGVRRQYPWIFSLTVNNGAEVTETPEHNRFQALFLDAEFVGDVYDHIMGETRERELRDRLGPLMFPSGNFRHELIGPLPSSSKLAPLDVCFEERLAIPQRNHVTYSGSADVQISRYRSRPELRVEIKPAMGDDYPAVLRQMKASHCNVLYLVAYTGAGATLQQVEKMFNAAGIHVLTHSMFWE